jgi:hypothetical protein
MRRVGGRALATLLHQQQPCEARALRALHASTSGLGFAPGSTSASPRSTGAPPYVAKLSASRPAPVVIMDEDTDSVRRPLDVASAAGNAGRSAFSPPLPHTGLGLGSGQGSRSSTSLAPGG